MKKKFQYDLIEQEKTLRTEMSVQQKKFQDDLNKNFMNKTDNMKRKFKEDLEEKLTTKTVELRMEMQGLIRKQLEEMENKEKVKEGMLLNLIPGEAISKELILKDKKAILKQKTSGGNWCKSFARFGDLSTVSVTKFKVSFGTPNALFAIIPQRMKLKDHNYLNKVF